MSDIKVTGLDKLQKQLKQNATLEEVKMTVRKHGNELQRNMQGKADFTKGYATGATKKSIKRETLDAGFTVRVAPETEYSPYLEYGTRFMEPQPFVRPALDEQAPKFKSDLQKLCK